MAEWDLVMTGMDLIHFTLLIMMQIHVLQFILAVRVNGATLHLLGVMKVLQSLVVHHGILTRQKCLYMNIAVLLLIITFANKITKRKNVKKRPTFFFFLNF